MTTEQRNNAIVAFMGGPEALRKALGHHDDAEFDFTELKDLRFHLSWDWMIPVWSKVRYEMTPNMVFAAIQFTDTADLEGMHLLVSNVCINWCKKNGIEL
jgi:hypothetical protein